MKRLFFRISLLCFSLLCFSAFTQTPALKCSEGEYYCETELACKPANELCTILSCDDKVVFGYTGADRNYIVPADVTKIEVKAWGAGGSGVRNFSASGV